MTSEFLYVDTDVYPEMLQIHLKTKIIKYIPSRPHTWQVDDQVYQRLSLSKVQDEDVAGIEP